MKTTGERIRSKIWDGATLMQHRALWQIKPQKVVFTNGCFDIVHSGHLDYLQKAADMGDFLILGLNSDASVRRLKGAARPINDEAARALLLASLAFVGAVLIFEEDTPYRLIQQIQPAVLVKGGDYDLKDIIGADEVQAAGGIVQTIPFIHFTSTTQMIERLKNA